MVVTIGSTARQAAPGRETTDATPSPASHAEALKAVVRRNTEQVQGAGDFALFEELFDDDFVDHTAQPGTTADRAGVRVLYNRPRAAFPDFRPETHWQTTDGDIVTTYKTYHGTRQGGFLIAPNGKTIQFETVDAMRVRDGKITDHWGWPICTPSCTTGTIARLSPTRPVWDSRRGSRAGRELGCAGYGLASLRCHTVENGVDQVSIEMRNVLPNGPRYGRARDFTETVELARVVERSTNDTARSTSARNASTTTVEMFGQRR